MEGLSSYTLGKQCAQNFACIHQAGQLSFQVRGEWIRCGVGAWPIHAMSQLQTGQDEQSCRVQVAITLQKQELHTKSY